MAWNDVEIRGVVDPFRDAEAKGWDIVNASTLEEDLTIDADVAIVGSGAGGGVAAETLAELGLKVVILEEGMLKSSDQFNMVERDAFIDLYQEGGLRRTKDGAIVMVQGRGVGGGTTINWCSCFRTPGQTLQHWRDAYGLEGCGEDDLAPHFSYLDERLNISEWDVPPNMNNEVLKRGAERLGYEWKTIQRNVSACWNLGYCGVGCPVDAKQSTLVTTIPGALGHDATLIYRVDVDEVTTSGERVTGVKGYAITANGRKRTGQRIEVRARHTILAGGAINTPAILLRSDAPDPHKRIGKRTFLHPVPTSLAQFAEQIDPYYGAPQSIYSDEFTWADGVTGPAGFKLEVMPMLPTSFVVTQSRHGVELKEAMEMLPHINSMIAFIRDGFHDDSPGGVVELGEGRRPVLDYPVTPYILDGAKRALTRMVEIQFAAGAERVQPGHVDANWHTSAEACLQELDTLDFAPGKVNLSSAHPMGGCAMGEDETLCVTDSRGRFRFLEGLSIFDGSLFPTSLGANPQLSIFGFARKFSSELGRDLT